VTRIPEVSGSKPEEDLITLKSLQWSFLASPGECRTGAVNYATTGSFDTSSLILFIILYKGKGKVGPVLT
jgi:hypothetical protein